MKITINLSTSKPVLIENAALLRMSNGHHAAAAPDLLGDLSNGADAKLANGGGHIPIKGPLDKQIEVKTSDGRRRITPMYIPPVVEANGEWSRHSFSSERQGFNTEQIFRNILEHIRVNSSVYNF